MNQHEVVKRAEDGTLAETMQGPAVTTVEVPKKVVALAGGVMCCSEAAVVMLKPDTGEV